MSIEKRKGTWVWEHIEKADSPIELLKATDKELIALINPSEAPTDDDPQRKQFRVPVTLRDLIGF